MNTTFILNGGAGRVITAIPALELYQKLNPNDDFKVLVSGWDSLYFCHPLLHTKTYSFNLPHLFDKIKNTNIVCPEPYFSTNYINQKFNLVEAYNEKINGSDTNHLLASPKLYLSDMEQAKATEMLTTMRYEFQREKIIVFQPYGSSAELIGGQVVDPSNRSLSTETYLEILNYLCEDNIVIYFGPKEFISPNDTLSVKIDQVADIRTYCSLIAYSNYFLGVDSVGQHIAKSFDIPGTVIMGSTFEKNVSYVNYFNFFRSSNRIPVFSPLRLNDFDREFADRQNDGIMNFSNIDVTNLYNSVLTHMNQINKITTHNTTEIEDYVIGDDYE